MFKKIFGYFATNRTLVNIILIMIVIAGVAGLFSIGQEVFPNTEMDRMMVTVTYPGASPIDVENNVVIPLERKLEAISGIKEYSSVIVENGASLEISLEDGLANTRTVKDQIIRDLNNVTGLPSEADVTVSDMNPKLMAVYTIGLHVKDGASATTAELYDYAKKLKEKLLNLSTVSEVRTDGMEDPEVHIYVYPDKMNSYYVSLNDVVSSIQNRNVRSTGGSLQSVQKEQTIVTIGQFNNLKEVSNVIVRSSFDNKRVLIKDIGRVEDGFEDKTIGIRINRKPGITISIVKKENSDIVKTIESVKRFLQKEKANMPSNLDISVISDTSLSIRSLVGVVQSNAISGVILVFLALILLLDRKSAVWVSVGIVLVILMTVAYMAGTGISFNQISLAALVTVLGMIVDNGIVVSENIYSYRQRGLSPLDATITGLKEVFGAILVSTLTTIAAFVPVMMIKGMMGKFIHQFPMVVIVALTASFLQAIFILPNQLMYGKEKKIVKEEKVKRHWFEDVVDGFKNILRFLIRHRYAVLSGFVVLLVFTIFISVKDMKRFVLFSDNSSDTLSIELEASEGSYLSRTTELTKFIEDAVYRSVQSNELLAVRTTVGKKSGGRDIGAEQHENWAQVAVYLVPVNDRKRDADAIIRSINSNIGNQYSNIFPSIVVEKEVKGPNSGKAVEIRLSGSDTNNLVLAANEIKAFLATVKGVSGIEDDNKAGKEELLIQFDYDKMARLSMNVATVASAVRTAYRGTVASTVQRRDEELGFRVEVDPKYKRDRYFLENLLIPNTEGRLIPLKDFTSIRTQSGAAAIRRYDGYRTITVEADVDPKIQTSRGAMFEVMKKFGDIDKKYPGVSFGTGGEFQETQDSLKSLAIALLIAVLAIYLVLVLLFNHAIQPVLILSVLPFGLIGALLAFKLHGVPLSFMGVIGIIGLCGVVVNNGIVMVDLINKLLSKKGSQTKSSVLENIIEGTGTRLRPIVLTSVTTIFGLLPTVYGIGGRAESIVPIVMALAYGLLFGTLLTLVLLPCLFMITVDLGWVKLNHASAEPSALPSSEEQN